MRVTLCCETLRIDDDIDKPLHDVTYNEPMNCWLLDDDGKQQKVAAGGDATSNTDEGTEGNSDKNNGISCIVFVIIVNRTINIGLKILQSHLRFQ